MIGAARIADLGGERLEALSIHDVVELAVECADDGVPAPRWTIRCG
jgi:hypothetical protein